MLHELNLRECFSLYSTTITTIGYGNQVPVTPLGRILLVLYGLIGVPLALVTIGDISKFVASFILHIYVRLQQQFGGQMAFVDFNSQSLSILLVISAIYPLTVGLLPLLWEPGWSTLETIYFSFISTFSIGYGDIMPSSPLTFTLTVFTVLVGLVFNSVLVDLVGGHVIQKIHYAGRISPQARQRFNAIMAYAANIKTKNMQCE
uniref:Ion_trans_2 domain-containing protein n=1 Tax=Ascaris lumbricoides TaxID=6252 RepID=A0A0M3HS63_ASCLU